VKESPETIVSRFMGAMRQQDWASCAAALHPDALDEFATYFKELSKVDETGQIAVFLGDRQPEQIRSMSSAAVFESVMQAISSFQPEMSEALSSSEAEVLGVVPEGELRHVVYRIGMSVGGVEIRKIEVVSAKPYQGEWRALLTGELDGLVAQMRAAFEAKH
jgi:hypothetical protein